MPLTPSSYRAPWPFANGHLATIYSALLRRVLPAPQTRERLELDDGDYLDLDWTSPQGPERGILILLHGLEGHAQRPYMMGSTALFSASGFRICAVNLRGCSGTPNRLYRSYHSGATEDLAAVVHHVSRKYPDAPLFLKGFSLGGNLLLKFLGENGPLAGRIRGAVAVSAPVHLHDSLLQLNKAENALYARRFLKNLKAKLREKQKLFPDRLPDGLIRSIRSLQDFDDQYTSKAHGFRDALDYYEKCSSLPLLPNIERPTLLLNARNDSFLGRACYPEEVGMHHPHLTLEIPENGGHVGFVQRNAYYYNEVRALEFLSGLF